MPSRYPLVVIVGPTAVGKTEISIQLAELLDGEIVSADSRLFYKGMDIGTAKPTLEERSRVPHHLIDVADPAATWNLAIFQKAATEVIADIHQRGKLPLLVGGTGQYIHAVVKGWIPPDIEPDVHLRNVLEQLAKRRGPDWLHQHLAIIDATAAQWIDPRNSRRTIRAMEVIFSTGRRFSEQRGKSESPYKLLTIGLTRPRQLLYARLDSRIEAMFAAGLLEEVCYLLNQGYSTELPAMSAIGYQQCIAVVQNKINEEEAKAQMRRLTRLFIRRQANWFKAQDRSIHWFDLENANVSEIETFIRTFLGKGKV